MPRSARAWPGLALLLSMLSTPAAAVLKAAEVENFLPECWPSDDYNLSLRFAPVEKLAAESQEQGQWSYRFRNEDQAYAGNRIELPDRQALRVDLLLQLDRSNSGIGEGFLWNVVVAPTVRGWKYGGHWPTRRPITDYRRLFDKRQSLIDMATLSAHEGQPVHTRIPPKDVDKAGSLNNAWADVFGRKIVDLVYSASKGETSGEGGYSLTFYYVPTPALRYINTQGYKWPSFKHVDRAGKVFGFVLTPDGECIGSSSIEVVAP